MPGLKRQPPTEKQEENTFKIPDTHIYPTCSPQLPITHLPSEKAEPCRMPLSNEMQLCLHFSLWRLEKNNSDFPRGLSPRGQYLDMLPMLCYSSLILYLLSSGAEMCENYAPSKKHQQSIRQLVKPGIYWLCPLWNISPSSPRTISRVPQGFAFFRFFTPSQSLSLSQHLYEEQHYLLFPCFFSLLT